MIFHVRKEVQHPLCLHCGIKGHVVDKCYKLHGYPSGYKFRNSASTIEASASKLVGADNVIQSQPNFFNSLNTTWYTQLMKMMLGI